MAYDIPSISDLEAIQLLNKHYAEVITSKEGGVSSAADITQTTNPITGVVRRTLYKILDDMDDTFLERLLKMAFTPVGTFTAGATLTDARQTLLWEVSEGGDGHYYSWSGSFGTSGKVVAAGSSPSPIAAGSWVDRTDDSLRDEIRETVFQNMKHQAAEAGFNLVDGSFEEGAVISSWPDVVWCQADGKYYQWHLDEAKTVAGGSTPATSGGIGAGAWVDRTDSNLRSELLENIIIRRGGYDKYSLANFVFVEDFGAVGDGTAHYLSEYFPTLAAAQAVYPFVTDIATTTIDTAAILAAVEYVTTGGEVCFNKKSYVCSPFQVTKIVSFVGKGNGKWYGSGTMLKLAHNSAYMVKVGEATTYPSVIYIGTSFTNIVFNGDDKTVTDALLVVENMASPKFTRCCWCYVYGSANRLQSVYEATFTECIWTRVWAGNAEAVILIDSVYNSILDANVNNLNYIQCHFEMNDGVYFKSKSDSNLDVLRITHSKFEWNLPSAPTATYKSVFAFQQGYRIDISHCHFTNYNNANKYNTVLYLGVIGQSYSAYVSFTDNKFTNMDANTYIVRLFGGSRAVIRNNTAMNGSVGLILNQSTNAQDIELPIYDNNSNGIALSKRIQNDSQFGFMSVHRFASNKNKFVQATDSMSVAGSVVATLSASDVIADIPMTMFRGIDKAIQIGVRCKSSAAVGKCVLIVGTTSFQIAVNTTVYSTKYIDIPSYMLATLGDNVNDRLRLSTASDNSDTVYVDGFYINVLGTKNPNIPAGYFSGVVLNSGTATIDVVSDVNQRGLYLISADIPGVGYAIVYSNGIHLVGVSVGTDFAVGTANPATAGKFNVYLSSNSIMINNLYGTDRTVSVYPFLAL